MNVIARAGLDITLGMTAALDATATCFDAAEPGVCSATNGDEFIGDGGVASAPGSGDGAETIKGTDLPGDTGGVRVTGTELATKAPDGIHRAEWVDRFMVHCPRRSHWSADGRVDLKLSGFRLPRHQAKILAAALGEIEFSRFDLDDIRFHRSYIRIVGRDPLEFAVVRQVTEAESQREPDYLYPVALITRDRGSLYITRYDSRHQTAQAVQYVGARRTRWVVRKCVAHTHHSPEYRRRIIVDLQSGEMREDERVPRNVSNAPRRPHTLLQVLWHGIFHPLVALGYLYDVFFNRWALPRCYDVDELIEDPSSVGDPVDLDLTRSYL